MIIPRRRKIGYRAPKPLEGEKKKRKNGNLIYSAKHKKRIRKYFEYREGLQNSKAGYDLSSPTQWP